MLVYTHKVFDTVVVPGTTEECDPALWSELARASDLCVTMRATSVDASTQFYVRAETSDDGRRWRMLFEGKTTPAPGSTTVNFMQGVQVAVGCNLRFIAYQASTGSCRVECWVTGRAKKSRSASRRSSIVMPSREIVAGSRITGGTPSRGVPPSPKGGSRLVGANMATRGAQSAARQSGVGFGARFDGQYRGAVPGAIVPVRPAKEPHGDSSGCGCKQCGDKGSPFDRPLTPIDLPTMCPNLIHDRRRVNPLVPRVVLDGWWEPFSEQQNRQIMFAFDVADEAWGRPIRPGIDPSRLGVDGTTPAWAPVPAGADEVTVNRLQSDRYEKMRVYGAMQRPLPVDMLGRNSWIGELAEGLAAVEDGDFLSVRALADNMLDRGILLYDAASSDAWSKALAFFLAVQTQETVCWTGYSIANPSERGFPLVTFAGYYEPPQGFCWGGSCLPLDVPQHSFEPSIRGGQIPALIPGAVDSASIAAERARAVNALTLAIRLVVIGHPATEALISCWFPDAGVELARLQSVLIEARDALSVIPIRVRDWDHEEGDPRYWVLDRALRSLNSPTGVFGLPPVVLPRSEWFIALYPPYESEPELRTTRLIHESFHLLSEAVAHEGAFANAFRLQGFVSSLTGVAFNRENVALNAPNTCTP
jgi:hypothetical protein